MSLNEDEVDLDYQKMLDMLDRAVFTKYKKNRRLLCSLSDKSIDLNEHRDLIAGMGIFTVMETDKYWTKYTNE